MCELNFILHKNACIDIRENAIHHNIKQSKKKEK